MLLPVTRLLCSLCVRVCVRVLGHHSGVELRRVGLNGAVQSGWSDLPAVVTPIFLRERSSVTEMERVKVGRVVAAGPEVDRRTNWKRLISQTTPNGIMCGPENRPW